ncbi:MAG: 16S rRNA (cytosine(1402)-N(4))-methyltransferase RsmH [Clostridiales bacterium]|jgi:16S rRNA (cytosine1402-N4)-methyltransferase|nr:16S rRNA (cytosine(1402)-N(4))-methyltransferase RsmH [Clostridiales bacterium]
MTLYRHTPVLLRETLDLLRVMPDGVYVDGTLGGAGHAAEIAARLTGGLLIGVDQDQDAIAQSAFTLAPYGGKVKLVKENFAHMRRVFADLGIDKADGVLLDLGVSSYQVDADARGFTYQRDAPLDMRMNEEADLTAYEVVNQYREESLTQIFFSYGEEKYARRIARAIVQSRTRKPIASTLELVSIVKNAMPRQALMGGPHPAKRIFQAIRIEVNQELSILDTALDDIIHLLNPGGRICVIGYHSLEDRIVKRNFKRAESPCVCPPDFPVCVCGKTPQVHILTKKPVRPGAEEIAANHRARSAKLRAAEKMSTKE